MSLALLFPPFLADLLRACFPATERECCGHCVAQQQRAFEATVQGVCAGCGAFGVLASGIRVSEVKNPGSFLGRCSGAFLQLA
jgi:hypothetical protein